MLCDKCNNNKFYIGIGYVKVDCEDCMEKEEVPPINKESSSYKHAIQEIMSTRKGMKRKEAEKLFHDSYFNN